MLNFNSKVLLHVIIKYGLFIHNITVNPFHSVFSQYQLYTVMFLPEAIDITEAYDCDVALYRLSLSSSLSIYGCKILLFKVIISSFNK